MMMVMVMVVVMVLAGQAQRVGPEQRRRIVRVAVAEAQRVGSHQVRRSSGYHLGRGGDLLQQRRADGVGAVASGGRGCHRCRAQQRIQAHDVRLSGA